MVNVSNNEVETRGCCYAPENSKRCLDASWVHAPKHHNQTHYLDFKRSMQVSANRPERHWRGAPCSGAKMEGVLPLTKTGRILLRFLCGYFGIAPVRPFPSRNLIVSNKRGVHVQSCFLDPRCTRWAWMAVPSLVFRS